MDQAPSATSVREPSFEEIFTLSLDLLCIGGLDGYFKRVNPAFEQAFGYSSQELLSRPFLDFVHPHDRARSRDAFEQLIHGQEIGLLENRNVRADGSTLWLEWSARPVPGEPIFYGAGHDIGDRKRSEGQLRRAKEIVEASRDELRVLAEEQAALRRVATLVARRVSPTEILDAVAVEAARLLGADLALLERYESDGGATILASRGEVASHLPAGTRITVDPETVVGRVLDSGSAIRVADYADVPGHWASVAREGGVRSAVGAPITVEGRLWGVMIVASAGDQRLPLDTTDRLAEFAELLATAIANTESRTQLTESRARVVAEGDEARRRVVRDLHDGAQQRLVHTIVTLKLAQRELRDREPAGALVAEALVQAEQANAELRELAHGILPSVLSRGGLGAGVDALVSRIDLAVAVEVTDERFPPAIEAAAYFVVAEALTNVVKHSRAERAEVMATATDGVLHVDVRDDGVGGAITDGAGLVGLDDRVAAFGGRLRVESPPGGGTLVAAALPLPV
jgi:PAS domain S-box-containing protein